MERVQGGARTQWSASAACRNSWTNAGIRAGEGPPAGAEGTSYTWRVKNWRYGRGTKITKFTLDFL